MYNFNHSMQKSVNIVLTVLHFYMPKPGNKFQEFHFHHPEVNYFFERVKIRSVVNAS